VNIGNHFFQTPVINLLWNFFLIWYSKTPWFGKVLDELGSNGINIRSWTRKKRPFMRTLLSLG